MGCGYVVCLALGLAGLGLLYVAQARFEERRQPEGWIAGAFGLLLTVGSVVLIAPMQREVARAKDRAARAEAKPAEPWTWDPTWTDPRGILQSGRRHGRALVGFAIVALGISSPALLVFREESRRGNPLVWLVLLFPLVSGGILAVAARDAWRRRKYGTARFVPIALPVPLGGEAAGMVLVNRPVVPSGAGRVSLDCWSTRITKSGGKRTQREEVVAHTEREVAVTDWSTTTGESRLLVQLPLRAGRASTMAPAGVDHPAFEWRLRVEMPTAGADFVAEFVLPVFEVAGVPRQGNGIQSSETVGVTASRSVPERAEILRAAGITAMARPGAVRGEALVFPVGLGRGLVVVPLVMAVVFGALATVLWFSPVPGVIAVFLGLFAVLPALVVPSLWSGGGERIWLEGGDVWIQRGNRPPRRVALDEVQKFEASKSVGAGAQQFYRIVARIRPAREGRFPSRKAIASTVRGDEAATEVVAWLEERRPRDRR